MTPNEIVLTFGGLHLCVQFGENRQRNATVRHTDRQTDTQTDANRFYYLSHAICYSMGQIIKSVYAVYLYVCSVQVSQLAKIGGVHVRDCTKKILLRYVLSHSMTVN